MIINILILFFIHMLQNRKKENKRKQKNKQKDSRAANKAFVR